MNLYETIKNGMTVSNTEAVISIMKSKADFVIKVRQSTLPEAQQTGLVKLACDWFDYRALKVLASFMDISESRYKEAIPLLYEIAVNKTYH
jgi:hypothetical protein